MSSIPILVCLFHFQEIHNDCNQSHRNQREEQIHKVQHVDCRLRLRRRSVHISACIQQDSAKRCSDSASDLDSQRGTGEHCSFNMLALRPDRVFRCFGDQCVDISVTGLAHNPPSAAQISIIGMFRDSPAMTNPILNTTAAQ